MANSDRPLSPHLGVYRWQMTMVLSIFHRLTGVALAAGAALVTWLLYATVTGEPQFNRFHAFAASWPGRAALYGFLWAFIFHFMNGIRHLVWDTGRGFAVKTASSSAWFVFIASLVAAELVFCYAGGTFK